MPAVQPFLFLVRIEFAATSDHGPWWPKYQTRQNDVGLNLCSRNPQTLSSPITEPTGNQIAIDFPIPSRAQFSRPRGAWAMSSIYVLEPPTKGKVVLQTTHGPLDVELWPKEAPKAVRNFIQLCLEGYYDNTIFHRIIKGFLVQGGDPTGTGTGTRRNVENFGCWICVVIWVTSDLGFWDWIVGGFLQVVKVFMVVFLLMSFIRVWDSSIGV